MELYEGGEYAITGPLAGAFIQRGDCVEEMGVVSSKFHKYNGSRNRQVIQRVTLRPTEIRPVSCIHPLVLVDLGRLFGEGTILSDIFQKVQNLSSDGASDIDFVEATCLFLTRLGEIYRDLWDTLGHRNITYRTILDILSWSSSVGTWKDRLLRRLLVGIDTGHLEISADNGHLLLLGCGRKGERGLFRETDGSLLRVYNLSDYMARSVTATRAKFLSIGVQLLAVRYEKVVGGSALKDVVRHLPTGMYRVRQVLPLSASDFSKILRNQENAFNVLHNSHEWEQFRSKIYPAGVNFQQYDTERVHPCSTYSNPEKYTPYPLVQKPVVQRVEEIKYKHMIE